MAEGLIRFFESVNAFGSRQWAFQKNKSHTDLVALLVNTWIMKLDEGSKIGVFLSDIAGAFDRVDSSLLLCKLHRAGLNSEFLPFFRSFLLPRSATIVAEGCHSSPIALENQVCQGTVVGLPQVWTVWHKRTRNCQSCSPVCSHAGRAYAVSYLQRAA